MTGRAEEAGDLGLCPLWGRPMIKGPSTDRHHWTPRSKGGRDWSYMHRICHKKLHAVFSERELAESFYDVERLRAHPEIASFVKWVRRQPVEKTGRHRSPSRRR